MTIENKLLITTAIKEVRGEEDLILLGEWCKPFDEDGFWKNKQHQVHPYHWFDPKKVAKDNEYLQEIYEKKLIQLTEDLNKFHGTDFSKRFWRILVGPWLISFVSSIWDRWECVDSFLKSNSQNQFYFKRLNLEPYQPPNDFNTSLNQISNDIWNEKIFSELLAMNNIKYKQLLAFKGSSYMDSTSSKDLLKNKSFLKKHLKNIIYILFLRSKRNQKITIYHSYFPKNFLLLLKIRLFNFSSLNAYFDENIDYVNEANQEHKKFREPDDLKSNFANDFESFLNKKILECMPLAYLEGFRALLDKANRIPASKSIMTANAHFGNEIFKVWAGMQCEKGAKLVISSHGGAIYPLFSVFNHQEKIADHRIIWGKAWMEDQITLPPNKLNFKVKKINVDGQVSIFDTDSLRYSYRCMSASQGPLVNKCLQKTKVLISELKKHSINVGVRVKSRENKLEFFYKNNFGKNILQKNTLPLNKAISLSRLIICTYPQTVYAESMYSGVPTILVYDPDVWTTQPVYKDLIEDMKNNNLIFEDPFLAARHIKLIYNDTEEWWRSSEVVNTRNHFKEMCITVDTKKFSQWVNFFKQL